ncbi:uncharacterized protein [Aegilops tauschii subsp. strangulata]|uniref:uncharacterized protein n=1 Tax=Aegilops tauschii subsp. strangulata TaxID=200361 RepID=UPI003CC8708C
MGFVDEYREVQAYDNTKLHVIHTNDKKQMATSLKQYECHLRFQCHKIVGIDLEYTNEPEGTQRPHLVQLSVDKTQPVLLFQLGAAERCTVFDNFLADPRYTFAGFSIDDDKTRLERVKLEVANFIDIQMEWRVPEATKELDSLADIAGMLVDDYYNDMKKKITNEEHKRWDSLPLSMSHIKYAAKDMYTAYKIWNRITLTQDGLRHAKLEKEEPPQEAWQELGRLHVLKKQTVPAKEVSPTLLVSFYIYHHICFLLFAYVKLVCL